MRSPGRWWQCIQRRLSKEENSEEVWGLGTQAAERKRKQFILEILRRKDTFGNSIVRGRISEDYTKFLFT